MLDKWTRQIVKKPLDFLGKKLSKVGLSANSITLIGFGFGLLALWSIASGMLLEGLGFFCLNRLMDGLDGAVARVTKLTDRGGFLDIVCDFIIYSGMVFAFAIYKPEMMFWALFLVFSFIGATSTFLAYAIVVAKHQKPSQVWDEKSFFYLGGISEGTETIIALSLMCLYPQYFESIALVFGIMCWLTTLGRSFQAWKGFKHQES